MNLVVTGDVGAGKTTWCYRYCTKLKKHGISVGGIVCPALYRDNAKIGFDVVNLRSGKSLAMGRVTSLEGVSGVKVGKYVISKDGLTIAKEAIMEALDDACDVVFLDEIGPLELDGEGLEECVRAAFKDAPNTVSVVRKTLLPSFFQTFTMIGNGFIVQDISSTDSPECLPGYPRGLLQPNS